VALSTSYLTGSASFGISMTTLISCGGLLPVGTRSRPMGVSGRAGGRAFYAACPRRAGPGSELVRDADEGVVVHPRLHAHGHPDFGPPADPRLHRGLRVDPPLVAQFGLPFVAAEVRRDQPARADPAVDQAQVVPRRDVMEARGDLPGQPVGVREPATGAHLRAARGAEGMAYLDARHELA